MMYQHEIHTNHMGQGDKHWIKLKKEQRSDSINSFNISKQNYEQSQTK